MWHTHSCSCCRSCEKKKRSVVLAAVKHFNQVNGFPPEKIIVYRDGVGDGQLEYVQEYGIGQMKRCFGAMQIQ